MSDMIILIGIPASGKSTARKFIRTDWYDDTISIICPDEIRQVIFKTEFDKDLEGMVWFTAKAMAKMLMLQDQHVLIDATNTTSSVRKDWLALAKECDVETIGVVMTTSPEVCFERNASRERVVPDEVMERMVEGYEYPILDEGFDKIMRF